jgi:hypothetical protein
MVFPQAPRCNATVWCRYLMRDRIRSFDLKIYASSEPVLRRESKRAVILRRYREPGSMHGGRTMLVEVHGATRELGFSDQVSREPNRPLARVHRALRSFPGGGCQKTTVQPDRRA